VSLSRALLQDIRSLDEFDLRRLMVFIGEMVSVKAGRLPPVAPAIIRDASAKRVSYRRQLIRCGKRACSTCPHGPYWYAFWRQDGRVRSRYVGKELPSTAGA